MTKLLRNRTVTFMLAILAFMTFTLGPDAWCPMQARAVAAQAVGQAMASCHEMAPPAQVHGSQPSKQAHNGGQHSCCKICVCHPGISALPATSVMPPMLAAARFLPHRALHAAVPQRAFTNKSSPRGPPLQL